MSLQSGGGGGGSTNQQHPIEKDYVDLHELAKGWKAAIARATDPAYRHEAQVKNDRGNLPLHSAASFRSPLEVTESLLEAYPEAAGLTNNYGNLALHFTAWKKGPLDVEKLLLKVFPEGAAQKNNHGNLPLHYAAHYNAPLEVVEALYHAYPEGAHQKNNDANTPLDLAIADGASPNVVALLHGKTVPPADDEVLAQTKSRYERLEKELQSYMERHDSVHDDLSVVLELLSDIRERHPHALYSAGIDPSRVVDMDSLLKEVRKAGEEEQLGKEDGDDGIGGPSSSRFGPGRGGGGPGSEYGMGIGDEESPEDVVTPADDEVERLLSKLVGLDYVKNQIRGLRRTIELSNQNDRNATNKDRRLPPHLAIVGNPGTGKTYTARILGQLLYKIGAVERDVVVEVGRSELVEKTETKTIAKTKLIIERARGGVLFVDEAYTLLPSPARRAGIAGGGARGDHGSAALRTIAEILPDGDPLVIMGGYSTELQLLLTNNTLSLKENFLLQMELTNPNPHDMAKIFWTKARAKGLLFADGVTLDYIAELIENNTSEDWRCERNGRVGDLLLQSVRSMMKRRNRDGGATASVYGGGERGERGASPTRNTVLSPVSSKPPVTKPEDIIVTVEDMQNAFVSGL